MAKAIRQINKQVPNKQEEQMQIVSQIVEAVADNGEAILSMISIIKHINEMGVLDALNALLEKRTEVGAIAIQQMNQPTMYHVIKNGINGFKFLGSLDPDRMQLIMNAVNRGLERFTIAAEKGEEKSIWSIGKSMTNPEIKTSLGTMIEFLYGMGEVFSEDQHGQLH